MTCGRLVKLKRNRQYVILEKLHLRLTSPKYWDKNKKDFQCLGYLLEI